MHATSDAQRTCAIAPRCWYSVGHFGSRTEHVHQGSQARGTNLYSLRTARREEFNFEEIKVTVTEGE